MRYSQKLSRSWMFGEHCEHHRQKLFLLCSRACYPEDYVYVRSQARGLIVSEACLRLRIPILRKCKWEMKVPWCEVTEMHQHILSLTSCSHCWFQRNDKETNYNNNISLNLLLQELTFLEQASYLSSRGKCTIEVKLIKTYITKNSKTQCKKKSLPQRFLKSDHWVHNSAYYYFLQRSSVFIIRLIVKWQ